MTARSSSLYRFLPFPSAAAAVILMLPSLAAASSVLLSFAAADVTSAFFVHAAAVRAAAASSFFFAGCICYRWFCFLDFRGLGIVPRIRHSLQISLHFPPVTRFSLFRQLFLESLHCAWVFSLFSLGSHISPLHFCDHFSCGSCRLPLHLCSSCNTFCSPECNPATSGLLLEFCMWFVFEAPSCISCLAQSASVP